ncbi:MAG: amidase [Tepidisphaerales bacterium]
MHRRDILRGTLAGAAYAAIGGSLARAKDDQPAVSPPAPLNDLEEATIGQLQEAMAAGRATAESVTTQYLRRIRDIDRAGPTLNSVIELNPDALAIARELDAERKAKGARGPMHGIPVLVKDNLDTEDRMMTTAGSLALEGSIAPQDSSVVKKLREAGAVILGKTNLSEWANIRSSRSTSGWSGRGGLTKNPYALDRNPSGSSSGSAVAVAASLCAVALGTETDGSILSPATVCGVVGLKPTVGLVSRAGIIPIAHSQDTAGPMARTVRDAAILLGAIAGGDERDAATAGGRGKAQADYTSFLDADGLKGARIGVARQFFRSRRGADQVIQAGIEVMKGLGAAVVDPVEIPGLGKIGEAEFVVLLYELKADLNAYLASLGPGAPVHTLAEIIAFNEKNAAREMPYFGQDTFIEAQKKGPLTDKPYLDALEKCRQLSRDEGIDAVMEKHRLDAIVAPSGGPAAKTDLIYGDRDVGGSSTPAAVAGYPNITVPAGEVFGLPVGISFFGRAFSEPVLLRLAYAFEQATRARKPPRYPATVG